MDIKYDSGLIMDFYVKNTIIKKCSDLKDYCPNIDYNIYMIINVKNRTFDLLNITNTTFEYKLDNMIKPEKYRDRIDKGIITNIKIDYNKFKTVATISYYVDFFKKKVITLSANDLYLKRRDSEAKIEYIGQAQGRKNKRDAIDRLLKHETLQKILIDNSLNLENEAYIVLLNFELQTQFIMVPPPIEKTVMENIDPIERVEASLEPISKEFQINLCEAALINYFKPSYNIYLKNCFPLNNVKKYSSLFENKFDTLLLEFYVENEFRLDDYNYGVLLKTDTNKIHLTNGLINYSLVDDDLLSVFDYICENTNPIKK